MFYFHPVHRKCRKLVKNRRSHVQLLSKNGLNNNRMQKLDRVNRPQNGMGMMESRKTSSTYKIKQTLVIISNFIFRRDCNHYYNNYY